MTVVPRAWQATLSSTSDVCMNLSVPQIIEKKLHFYAIDAYDLARRAGMGTRINTIMQTCFFAIAGLLPRDRAIAQIKKSIEKTYGKRGAEVVTAITANGGRTRAPPGRRDRDEGRGSGAGSR